MQDLINKLLEIIPYSQITICSRTWVKTYYFAEGANLRGTGSTPEEALQDLLNKLTKK